MENQWNPFWLQIGLYPLATAPVNSGGQEWASSHWTHLSGCLLGLLFYVSTSLHCIFNFLLHPDNISLQFLLLAEQTCILRESSSLVMQVETSSANASWSVWDLQWPGVSFILCNTSLEEPLSTKGIFEWKRFQPFSIKEMVAWIRKERWMQITSKPQTYIWCSIRWAIDFSAPPLFFLDRVEANIPQYKLRSTVDIWGAGSWWIKISFQHDAPGKIKNKTTKRPLPFYLFSTQLCIEG